MVQTLSLDKIIIPNNYTKPSEKKVNKKMQRIKDGIPVEIVLNDKLRLIDGYASYVAYKNLGYESCEVKIWDVDKHIDNILHNNLEYVYNRDKGKCYICGRKCLPIGNGNTEDLSPTIDHVIPKSKGGTNELDNKKLCCSTCNSLKGNFTYSKELQSVIKNELKELGYLK